MTEQEMAARAARLAQEAEVTAVLKVGMSMVDQANKNRAMPPPRLPPKLLEILAADPDRFAQQLTASVMQHQGNLIVISCMQRMLDIGMFPNEAGREALILAIATFEEMMDYSTGSDPEAKDKAVKGALHRVVELMGDAIGQGGSR